MAHRINDSVVPLTITQHAENIFRTPTPPVTPTPVVSSGPLAHESPKKDTRVRPHIQVRLPDGALDVERQIANWRVEKKAAPKVVEAIRLLAAIDAGNLDYVRENYPLMVETLQRGKRRRPTLSLESESYKQIEKESDQEKKIEPAVEELAEAIDCITGRDRHLNRDVYALADELHQFNYTADDVRLWYEKCWPKHWAKERKPSAIPGLKFIREDIGSVRSLPSEELATPEQSTNPYLQDEYFRRTVDQDPLPPEKDEPVWPPEWCKVDNRMIACWEQAIGNARWRMYKPSYMMGLARARPIHCEGDPHERSTLFLSVPNEQCKAIIEESFDIRVIERWVNDFYDPDSLQKSPLPIRVEFVIAGDPIPIRSSGGSQ